MTEREQLETAKTPSAPSSPRQAGVGLAEPASDLDALAHRVIGAALTVHRTPGPDRIEGICEAALEIELRTCGIPFLRQVELAISYRGSTAGTHRPDLLIDQRLIVELKAAETVTRTRHAQVISYLMATGLRLGLLINFNEAMLRNGLKRVINSAPTTAVLGDLGALGALAVSSDSKETRCPPST